VGAAASESEKNLQLFAYTYLDKTKVVNDVTYRIFTRNTIHSIT
jgi:hypothetical protein